MVEGGYQGYSPELGKGVTATSSSAAHIEAELQIKRLFLAIIRQALADAWIVHNGKMTVEQGKYPAAKYHGPVKAVAWMQETADGQRPGSFGYYCGHVGLSAHAVLDRLPELLESSQPFHRRKT